MFTENYQDINIPDPGIRRKHFVGKDRATLQDALAAVERRHGVKCCCGAIRSSPEPLIYVGRARQSIHSARGLPFRVKFHRAGGKGGRGTVHTLPSRS